MRTGGGCRTADREISRFPRKERLHIPGSLTTPGRPGALGDAPGCVAFRHLHGVGTQNRNFRGSMAGLCAPLSTLRRDPRGHLRMTRGRCGSLLLHRKGLAPSTPCRSPGASHDLFRKPESTLGSSPRAGFFGIMLYPSSISPLISCFSSTVPRVIVAVAASFSLPLSRPSDNAWRTAFSISRWAPTPSVLRNLRMLALKTSSFIDRLLLPRTRTPRNLPTNRRFTASDCANIPH